MYVESIKYEKLVNTGNYEHEKIGVSVALEEGESVYDALKRARAFVQAALRPRPGERMIEAAQHKIDHADDYPPREVREAREFIAKAGAEEIPF